MTFVLEEHNLALFPNSSNKKITAIDPILQMNDVSVLLKLRKCLIGYTLLPSAEAMTQEYSHTFQ